MMTSAPLRLSGIELVPDSSGALVWPDEATLVVADLHFEKGSSFATRGVMLPPFDTRATLGRLESVCFKFRPRRVIALGDSFHDRGAASRLHAGDKARLERLTQACDWIWITGNHDPAPPQALGGRVAESVHLGPLVFRHVPSAGRDADGEIAGHLHPAACVAVRGLAIRRRCFASDGRRAILPAFGSFTGGLDVDSPAFDGLFKPKLTAWLLGQRGTYAFPIRRRVPIEETAR